MMRRWMMLALLCGPLCAPVWAQGEPTGEPKKEADEKADPQVEIHKVLEQLRAAEPEERKALVDRLKHLIRDAMEHPRGEGTAIPLLPQREVVLQVENNSDKETITGSWAEGDGVKGEYTLTSLGKSRYKLDASKSDAEGVVTKFEDEGTLAELREKYSFIQGVSIVALFDTTTGRVRRSGIPLVGDGPNRGAGTMGALFPFALAETQTRETFGMRLRRPSKELEYHLKIPTETAWIVDSVTPGSKAEELGLKKMDLITGADGSDLSEFATLEKATKVLTIIRRGKAERLSLE